MPNSKDPRSQDYEVGYRRPPKAAQFAPGKSGNPRGRPKGSRTIGAILKDIIEGKIAVTENGKVRRFQAIEVVFRRLVNDAVRGDKSAIKLLLSLADRHAASPETAPSHSDLMAEDREILARYLIGPGGQNTAQTKNVGNGTPDDGV